MSGQRYNVPPPRRDNAMPGGLERQTAALDLNPHGNSFDSSAPDASSSSRRPSGASVNSLSAYSAQQHGSNPPHSPASVSSSGTHPWATPRMDDAQWTNSPQQVGVTLPSTTQMPMPSVHKHALPRIATSAHDDESETGPRSAPPVSSPLAGPNPAYAQQQPLRSASSPDPRPQSNRGSPMTSPIDPRPSFSGPLPGAINTMVTMDQHAQAASSFPTPRGSSFPTNMPPAGAIHNIEGIPTPRRSDTPTSMASAHGTVVPVGTAPGPPQTQPVPPTAKRSGSVTYCAKCGLAVRGQFVRALHQVYHLDCFRCKDCDKVVAQKFFPVEDADGGQYPLCERDYFARLDLICGKCNQALRSSYITACGEKFHVEHFSCSVCDTVFGASDSYYEHGGKVYCHYHYSISFANKCVGCETAILKQFVEINRNGRDECWHPECYMIHKFWNVRLASRNFTTPTSTTPVSSSLSLLEMSSLNAQPISPSPTVPSASTSPAWGTAMTAEELKDRQIAMELKVSQIWLVLSGFEESSAACIGEMLRVVNERKLLDVILLAEKFILHVETLFAVIDDLEAQFALAGVKGMSHAREAKQLCRKLVNFFSMLSQISPHGGAIPNMQELLTQVTQLAHYLKILIRIALTGAIKLDREQGNPNAMMNALARLHLLSLDNAEPSLTKRGDHPEPTSPPEPWTGNESPDDMAKRSFDSLTRHPEGFIASTQKLAYGYRSLAVETTGETTLRGPQDDRFVPNDGCVRCNGAIEDDCVRQGMFNRWHSHCVECKTCGDKASNQRDTDSPLLTRPSHQTDDESQSHDGHHHELKVVTRRRSPRVGDFAYEPPQVQYAAADIVWCSLHRTASSIAGFQSVSRLEQFAFLLHVALRRLYLHFREHHGIPSAVTRTEAGQDVKRVKSVTLDRKLSSTARLPQRSTVVESPAGKMADENGQVVAPREPLAPLIVPTDESEGPASATVDIIRPPFARNNTGVRIVSEAQSEGALSDAPTQSSNTLAIPARRTKDDDAITLNDIPMLASRNTVLVRSPLDAMPLIAQLPSLQQLIVRHFALIQLQKTGLGHLIDVDELMELLDVRKNQWWNKLFKNNAKKDQKRKGIFGVPIEMLVARTGSDSQRGASDTYLLRVPEFIEDIVSTMRQQDMAIEGIFRKNGNIRKLQMLSEALDKDTSAVVLADENPVQLAALLKRFLREMPDPLLTFRLHKLFCATAVMPNAEDRKRCLLLLVTLLPKPNRDTLEVLFVFLRWVASFSYRDEETGSRMDLANLATVICPSILYAKGQNAARDESFIAIQAVQQMLEGQDDIWRVPSELTFVLQENVAQIFQKEIDLPPKEIHKHCAKYLQARGGAPPQHTVHPGRPSAGSVSAQGGQGPPSALPSGSMRELARDRPPDLRLSGYRPEASRVGSGGPSDGGFSRDGEIAGPGALRAAPSPSNNTSRPTSWGTGGIPGGVPGSSTPTSGSAGVLAMPMPQINGASVTSPSFPPGPGGMQHPMPSPGTWRGPFQGSAASNGSRQSSRGSAPPSPGVQPGDAERRSFQMERDRSRERAWTPTTTDSHAHARQ